MISYKLNKKIIFFFLGSLVSLSYVMSSPTNINENYYSEDISTRKLLIVKKIDDYKINLSNKIKNNNFVK
jgi:hypothetical protein